MTPDPDAGGERVAAAFHAVRREGFLTEDQREYASEDRPLPIGHGQTNSQPTTVRNMLELLDAQPGDRVLDVGSGSAWTTALLGYLVGPDGGVWGVELVPELVEWGRSNLAATGLGLGWTSVEPAEGRLGLARGAPYDRILVSAESRKLPDELVEQLATSGRLVVPVHGRLLVVDKDDDGGVDVHKVGHYAFVPLRRPQG
ncbi:MAG: protein-L-isoaspartate O-methyltransferase family protein [Nocardioidaceae bacterium]